MGRGHVAFHTSLDGFDFGSGSRESVDEVGGAFNDATTNECVNECRVTADLESFGLPVEERFRPIARKARAHGVKSTP
jgi:hypothetical protein